MKLFPTLSLVLLAVTASASDKPDVLFIAVDDLNDAIGALGHRQVKTPNIDRLAAMGMTFTNAHCPAPLCNPSRTAILFSQAPHNTQFFNNKSDWRTEPAFKGLTSLPMLFKKSGYLTAGSGKIYHAQQSAATSDEGRQKALEGFHERAAFERFYPDTTQLPPPAPNEERDFKSPLKLSGIPVRNESGKEVMGHFDFGPINVTDAETIDGRIAAWVSKELKSERNKPLFLAAGFYRPHAPLYVPAKWLDLYPLKTLQLPEVPKTDLDDVPPAGKRIAHSNIETALETYNKRAECVQAYYACISFVDAQIGKVLDTLDSSGNNKNTIIILWSDHGWHLGEKGHWQKSTLWERSTRVPLIVVAPGITKAGSRSNQPVSLLDIYPTLAELCGLSIPNKLDGTSLLPLLKDPTLKTSRMVVTSQAPGNHSIRSEQFRFISYGGKAEELYDMSNDPNEWKNLASDPKFQAIKAEHAALLPNK